MGSSLEIAIIGGGPAGLTLSRILQCKGFKHVKIYEKEESRFVRGQGGSLDLHPNTGQGALKLAGLLDEFNARCRHDGEDLRVLDSTATVVFEQIDESNGRPEIDRTQLRDILIDSIPEETIQWGHAMTSLQELDNGKLQVNFENGEKYTADFVVGADGGWSKVRPYLSPAKPIYSGLSLVECTLTNVDQCLPDIASLVGRGLMFALSQGKGFYAQRNSGSVIRVNSIIKVPQDWIKSRNIDFKDSHAIKQMLSSEFNGWDEKLLKMFQCHEGEFIPRPIFALPVGHSWSRVTMEEKSGIRSKVTLVGDAAHLMSPFAGEGVNLAMADATRLALALASSSKENVHEALLHYEKEMFRYAEEAARESANNLEMLLSEGGATKLANRAKDVLTHQFYTRGPNVYDPFPCVERF